MLFSYILDHIYLKMIQIFLLLYFSGVFVSVVSPPFVFSVIFCFPLIASSSLISSVISMIKILLGVPLFSILFLVYARIRIITKEFKVNTQQVLDVSDLTGKPLKLHRPSRFASCLPDFVYRTVWLIPESRLADWVVYPRQNSKRSFWANAKVSLSSSSINVFPVHSWPP